MLFDTHAHMDDRAFDDDRGELLSHLPEAGIGLLMNPGCSLDSSRAACALAEPLRHGGSTAGLEPWRQALGRAKAALDALAD